MKRYRQHIVFLLAAVMMLAASCRKDEAEVIPRGKLSKIYAEMLVTDQWIITTPGVRLIADTTLVYEPILQKYGYDSDDYRKSIDYYMNDPERFARIFRTTAEIIDNQIAELRREQAVLDAKAKLPKVESDFKVGDYVPYLDGEPYLHFYDSLDVVVDSATLMYRLVSIERSDTLFDGLKIVLRDSLNVTDSIAARDSIMARDSLMAADSILKTVAADSSRVQFDSLKLKTAPVREVMLLKKELEK